MMMSKCVFSVNDWLCMLDFVYDDAYIRKLIEQRKQVTQYTAIGSMSKAVEGVYE